LSFEVKDFPDKGELVIGTVEKIFEYGAYVRLDEYDNLRAYLPRNEVSTKWIRNIRDVLKEGQKAVFKVIRVDRRKGHVDVSLKRVSDGERRKKLLEWKKLQKSLKTLEIVASKLNRPFDDVLNTIGRRLAEKYGDLYIALEEIARFGEEAIRDLGFTEEEKKILVEEAKRHIEIKKVKISGTLFLFTVKGDGVKIIKDILTSAKNVEKPREVSVRIYTVGSPRYKVELIGLNYKELEKTLAKILDLVKTKAQQYGALMRFVRDRK